MKRLYTLLALVFLLVAPLNAQVIKLKGITSAPASPSNGAILYFDKNSNKLFVSANGGTYFPLIANGALASENGRNTASISPDGTLNLARTLTQGTSEYFVTPTYFQTQVAIPDSDTYVGTTAQGVNISTYVPESFTGPMSSPVEGMRVSGSHYGNGAVSTLRGMSTSAYLDGSTSAVGEATGLITHVVVQEGADITGKGFGLRAQAYASGSGSTAAELVTAHLDPPSALSGATVTKANTLFVAESTTATNRTNIIIGPVAGGAGDDVPVGNFNIISRSTNPSTFAGSITTSAFFGLEPVAAPAAPATGGVVYIDSADSDLKIKYADGTVVVIGNKP